MKITGKHLFEFGDRIQSIGDDRYFLPKFIRFQYGRLSPSCPAHKKVIDSIERHQLEENSLGYSYPNARVVIPYRIGKEEERIGREEEEAMPFVSESFSSAWKDWLQYQKQKKKKMTNLTIKSQFKKFKEWGESKSIAAIEQAIMNGWQGVFEPKIDPTMKASVVSKDNQGCMTRNFTSADVGI